MNAEDEFDHSPRANDLDNYWNAFFSSFVLYNVQYNLPDISIISSHCYHEDLGEDNRIALLGVLVGERGIDRGTKC